MNESHKVTHYYKEILDANLSMDIIQRDAQVQEIPVGLHWHEHLQLDVP
jgi:hypothetical protein